MHIRLLGRRNKVPQASWLEPQMYFLAVLGAGRSKMQVWHGLLCERSFWLAHGHFSECPDTDRERLWSVVVLIVALALSDSEPTH